MFLDTDFLNFRIAVMSALNALEPKFKKYRHILQGDFLRHS